MLLATLLLLQSPGMSAVAPPHRNGRVPPVATALRVSAPPRIDGVLDDAAWAAAPVSTGFRRDVPSDGKPATENSEIRVVYDDHALYVGARLYDRTGNVSRRLSRRDSFSVLNDVFFVAIDAFHDHSTEFIFGITPAGEQRDAIRSGDGSVFDASWDPVWEVKTKIDSLGWVAELRIPFSQLRFSRASEQTWGIQFRRDNRAAAEASDWSWSPRTEPGVTSKYGHLVGLSSIPQPRRLEVLPYTAASSRYTEGADPANPFDNGSVYDGSIGGDVRYGLTSNITLNATVNPDFGQVEADPAVVNLTAYETFFAENRPFFVERSDLFRFAEANGYPFFYTRRVGRTPSLSAAGAAPYVDAPPSTTILGAAKATGRASGGWSLGVLEAVTAKEYAHLASSDGQQLPDMGVEPLSNYAVARLRKDYAGGSSYVGGLITTVNRNLDEPQFDVLRSSAYVAGLDWRHRFGHNNWSTTGWISGSRVNGSRNAMVATQTASARYYQRPDQDYVTVDSAASSMSGYSAAAVVSKDGGEWTTYFGGGITSPGFEMNDAGFLLDADRIAVTTGVGRRWVTPGRTFRSFSVDAGVRQELNLGGVNIHRGTTLSVNGTFNNLWNFNIFGNYNAQASNDRVTRGGPLRLQPSVAQIYASVGTDNRKTVSVSVFGNYADAKSGAWSAGLGGSLTFRPQGAFDLTLSTNWFKSREDAFYVTQGADATATATYGSRYLFGVLDQQYLDNTIRLNWLLSPKISIQLYAQPLLATGDYEQFKALARPNSYDFLHYGTNGSTITFDEENQLYTTVAEPGAEAISFTNPDFRVRSLRSNLVFRWEYRPGSTLFIVWNQNRGSSIYDPTWNGVSDLWGLRHDPQQNVFLVKLNYYFNL